MTAKTPKRQNLLDVAEMAHEMFDGGHPERVPEILNAHLGADNPATDFVMAMWMFTANMLDRATPVGRQFFIEGARKVALVLPEDGGTLAEVSRATGRRYESVKF